MKEMKVTIFGIFNVDGQIFTTSIDVVHNSDYVEQICEHAGLKEEFLQSLFEFDKQVNVKDILISTAEV